MTNIRSVFISSKKQIVKRIFFWCLEFISDIKIEMRYFLCVSLGNNLTLFSQNNADEALSSPDLRK